MLHLCQLLLISKTNKQTNKKANTLPLDGVQDDRLCYITHTIAWVESLLNSNLPMASSTRNRLGEKLSRIPSPDSSAISPKQST